MSDQGEQSRESFRRFVAESGSRLQEALMACLGPEEGQDATSEALSYGWAHWDRIEAMENPTGYLYVLGRRRGFRARRRPTFPLVDRPAQASEPWIEPGLPDALQSLTERQRVSTLLVYGGGWTFAEVATLLGVDRGTVKKHAERGLGVLRAALGVVAHD